MIDYPEYMEANGNLYKINTDFRVGLACLKAIDDNAINDIERFYAIETLLLGFDVREEDEKILQEKMATYLRCGKESNYDGKIDMDFEQDKAYINASFMSTYRIDLSKEKMHWWAFNELIEGLTDESILYKIRELRNFDINEINDIKTRNKMRKAQNQVALVEKKEINRNKKLDEYWENALKRGDV